MMTGIQEIDEMIYRDKIVGFKFEDEVFMRIFYHRTIVESAPVSLLLVGDARIDPYLLRAFSRITEKEVEDKVRVRRAFKREDVVPTLNSFAGDLIIVNPYIYGCSIYPSLIKRKGRTFLFFTTEKTYLRAESSILELRREKEGDMIVRVRKSPSHPELKVKFPAYLLHCKEEFGLSKWL